MTANEIKKELYKQNPIANLILIHKGIVRYEASLYSEDNKYHIVSFNVPVSEMDNVAFFEAMIATSLIKYLNVDDGNKEPIRKVDEIY